MKSPDALEGRRARWSGRGADNRNVEPFLGYVWRRHLIAALRRSVTPEVGFDSTLQNRQW